jgi:hypothetical protein
MAAPQACLITNVNCSRRLINWSAALPNWKHGQEYHPEQRSQIQHPQRRWRL